MAGELGKDFLLKIGDNTVSPSSWTTLDCQGDLTLTPGKTLNRSKTKNCTHTFFTDDGFSGTFSFEGEKPLSATQNIILDAADNETLIDAQIISANTGSPYWQGLAYVTYSASFPTEGVVLYTCEISFEGTPTRGTV